MKKYSLLLFLLLFAINSSIFGQANKERQIEIAAFASINGTEFNIEITTSKANTKIRFKIHDSTSTKLNDDKEFNTHRNYLLSLKHFDLRNDTVLNYLSILKSITEKYTFYSKDSIELANSENESYLSLINKVFNSPTDSLNNKNKNIIILDGIGINFILKDNGSKREIHVNTPGLGSHPILYQLLKNSITIYREAKQNNFLNKYRLFGY